MSFFVVCMECEGENVDILVTERGTVVILECLDCGQEGGLEDLE